MDKLLTVEEAAERLGTSVRFVRRLIFERRIAYTELGRHARIVASDLDAFITAGRVDAGSSADRGGQAARHLDRSRPRQDHPGRVAGDLVGERRRPATLDGGAGSCL